MASTGVTAAAHVRANGLEIAYETEGVGDGPPLILLHGASSGGRLDFGAQLPHLARTFRCYLPDARGHGGTRWAPAPGEPFSHDALVDDLEGFVEALDLRGPVHLAGLSMGAGTALGFAIRHPARVASLVLAAISPEREPRAAVARRLLDGDRIHRDEPRWGQTLDRRHDPVQGEGAWELLLASVGAAIATVPLPEPADLRGVTAPALVMVGDRDPLVPVDQAWRLARQLRDGRLLVAPDCGHAVTALRPAIVNDALTVFYRPLLAAATEEVPT